MKISEILKIEDCFDGSSVFQYHFDLPWTRESISVLRQLGELDYFPDFPRPFFRLHTSNGLQIKGVEGEDNCRVIFPRKDKESIKEGFESIFE
jgi:hypothetical protein